MAAVNTLAVVPVPGDGNCLFSALALHEDGDEAALRTEVADFLEDHALEQGEFAEAWLEEADYLRGDKEDHWGGDTAITAYSLMRGKQIIVHTKPTGNGEVQVEDKTHQAVSLVNGAAPVIHVLYNGRNHYDGLVHIANTTNMVPAWPQPGPATYFEAAPAASPLPYQLSSRADFPALSTPTVPIKKRTKGQSGKRKAPPPMADEPSDPVPGSSSSVQALAHCPGTATLGSGDDGSAPLPGLEDDVLEEARKAKVAERSTHPHRMLEDKIAELATAQLRENPTVPPGRPIEAVDAGELWPRMFCAFKDCAWQAHSGTEQDLEQHLRQEHSKELLPLTKHLLRCNDRHALMSIYNQAIAHRCRGKPPLAGCSLDRRALKDFAGSTAANNVESHVCFSCACIYPRIADLGDKNAIGWHYVLREGNIFGNAPAKMEKLLGFKHFLAQYDDLGGGRKLTDHEDFNHWKLTVPSLQNIALLGCPEDHRCSRVPTHPSEGVVCEDCQVPLCRACSVALGKGQLPAMSLANDMFTGYAPKLISEERATVMELICASPCVTTLVCMSMDRKHCNEAAPMDEVAHMRRHRYGARGNALTFPLPWEDLRQALTAESERIFNGEPPALPRTGPELGDTVRVLLKTNKSGSTTEAEIKGLIHQANVRRHVIVRLIEHMKMNGHPAYAAVDMEVVKRRAQELPEDGVPPAVLAVIKTQAEDSSQDKLQPQKAATPTDGRHTRDSAAGDAFAKQRPKGVMAEGCADQDANQISVTELKRLKEDLRSRVEQEQVGVVEMRTGNTLIDQFNSFYMPLAFPFLFPYGTGRPDVFNHVAGPADQPAAPARRRKAGAPEVPIHQWAAAMQRRVETQFRRDWVFLFVVWNYLFRTMVNLLRNTCAYTVVGEDGAGVQALSPKDIVEAACGLLGKLKGKYSDLAGNQKAVGGDFSKLRFAKLTDPEMKVLQNVEARARQIPGTHEIRKTMRHHTHANRVVYGTSIFVTFSPSERDSQLMVRLARARESDPCLQNDTARSFQSRTLPELDVEYWEIAPDALAEHTLAYDDRVALLARDPMACAEGFNVLVMLVLRHLFGVRFCPQCPHCAFSEEPCTDLFGSNASPTGGIFGRIDAVYGSIETQKSTTRHGHFQLFVQGYHQHTALGDMIEKGPAHLRELLHGCAKYVSHVQRTVYDNPAAWHNQGRAALEEEWPEYRQSVLMVSRPTYQSHEAMTPEQWKQQYLNHDVERLQQHKQHHVHLPCGPEGQRMPLAHCRDPKDASKCKAGFPKDQQLAPEPWLVCPARAEEAGLPFKGKRNAVGLIMGPRNDPDVNGNHPALLAGLRCNGDVQVPYRVPCTAETHDPRCRGNCHLQASSKELVKAAQRNQAAQAGYACDYQNKRLPIAIHEIKEWGKGQQKLGVELEGKPAGYVGARVAKRLVTDCHARGVVRGAAECFALIDRANDQDPTSAESIKTAPARTLSARHGLKLMQAAYQQAPWPQEQCRTQTDTRDDAQRKVTACPPITLYGCRGQQPAVWELSLYEFVRHFWFRLARRPAKQNELRACGSDQYHADLTETGRGKFNLKSQRPDLKPGCDYVIREAGGAEWLPLGNGETAQSFRHDWIVVPHERPVVPVIAGAQGVRSGDEQAMLLLLLFVPWTNDVTQASESVPHISSFRRHYMIDWRSALRARLSTHGFPTAEAKRLVQNFCFVYCLPRELAPVEGLMENSDNEVEDDEPLVLSLEDQVAVRATHIRGGGRNVEEEAEADGDCDSDGGLLAIDEAADGCTQLQRTMQMFDISRSIWLRARENVAPDPRQAQHHEAFQAKDKIPNPQQVLAAARKTKGKAQTSHTPQASGPQLLQRPQLTEARLRNWLHSDAVRGQTNAKQFEMLEHVVDRLLVEYNLAKPEDTKRQSVEPLVWLLHGPPGTGKSHVLKFLRQLFDEVMGFRQGIDYEFTALQAVNAKDIKGKTLHHALGLSVATQAHEPVSAGTAKRISNWRWLITDEISLVMARLLGTGEHRLRGVIPSANEWKHNAAGVVRPFGGLNVILTGDFYQLPPPSGGYLADVPHSLRGQTDAVPDAMVEHGRELLWGEAVQGVTELEERQRCKDPWWNEVVDQLRNGRLSESNHKYLHGLPVQGCTLTPAERESRRRVILGSNDLRLKLPKFKDAVVIVANNDARYQINKDRAEAYGLESGAEVRWALARDVASSAALQSKPCDKKTKMQWLQLPDRSTGDLCGALPLAVGMPVALTDHWDRSDDKGLLRGSRGYVHSWEWCENEERPSVVYVKFEDADWQLEGTPEPGIYPVWPVKRAWFLDAGREKPVLKVTRLQVPLTPAFAITAHASQGKTLRAAMADLNVDKRTDVTFGTVATSRVRSREDFLILRPFPQWLYQRGAPEGPKLLLDTLRGENVDWELYREARAPMTPCKTCGELKQLDRFSYPQWECARANREAQCMLCSNAGNGPERRTNFKSKGPKLRCGSCVVYKIPEAFPRAQLVQDQADEKRKCITCCKALQFLSCSLCRQTKQADEFDPSMVTRVAEHAVCKECQDATKGTRKPEWFTCRGCSVFLPHKAAAPVAAGKQIRHCDNCKVGVERPTGQHTCRKCGGKWREAQTAQNKRQRLCPKCRKK